MSWKGFGASWEGVWKGAKRLFRFKARSFSRCWGGLAGFLGRSCGGLGGVLGGLLGSWGVLLGGSWPLTQGKDIWRGRVG